MPNVLHRLDLITQWRAEQKAEVCPWTMSVVDSSTMGWAALTSDDAFAAGHPIARIP